MIEDEQLNAICIPWPKNSANGNNNMAKMDLLKECGVNSLT